MSRSPDAPGATPVRTRVIQIAGFVVGLGLLAWCVAGAIGDDGAREGWRAIGRAHPALIAALLACTAASAVINGAVFFVTGRPLADLRSMDLQRLNLVANLLNYAPVRLGLAARVAWHMTVDRLSLLQIGGWFAVIGVVLVIGTGAAFGSTVLQPSIGPLWLALFVGQIAAGLVIFRFTGARVLARHGRGVERILQDRWAVWIAGGLRVADLAVYWARMAIAAAILELELDASALLVLAIVAFTSSLVPVGRMGFREFAVAAAGGWIGMESSGVDASMKQLALLDSAGEIGFYLVAGAVCLPWYRRRWTAALAERRRTTTADADGGAGGDADGHRGTATDAGTDAGTGTGTGRDADTDTDAGTGTDPPASHA